MTTDMLFAFVGLARRAQSRVCTALGTILLKKCGPRAYQLLMNNMSFSLAEDAVYISY